MALGYVRLILLEMMYQTLSFPLLLEDLIIKKSWLVAIDWNRKIFYVGDSVQEKCGVLSLRYPWSMNLLPTTREGTYS